jgi:hypothetical protein
MLGFSAAVAVADSAITEVATKANFGSHLRMRVI